MLDIQLDKNWKILTDRHNFILARKRKEGSNVKFKRKEENVGKDMWSHEYFYDTLEGILQRYLIEKQRSLNCKTIEKLLEETTMLKEDISNRILPLLPDTRTRIHSYHATQKCATL